MLKIKVKKQKVTGTKKEFAASEFFHSYKRKIIGVGGLCVIIVIGVSLLWLWVHHQEIEASLSFSQAKTIGDYEEIASRYSFTKTKSLAMITWARELFNQGKYAEAISVYKKFIKQYPRHKLIPSVLIALAYCHEEAGNFEEAETVLLKVKEDFSDTIWAKEAEEGYKRISST